MKLARFTVNGATLTGRVDGDEIVPLGDESTFDAIVAAGGTSGIEPRGSVSGLPIRCSEVRLLPPVVRGARCLFATGWNYRSHFAEGNAARGTTSDEPTVPTFFSKPATTVIGPNDNIAIDDAW